MKSPAFQFYPKDWLSSRRVRMMTSEQRGWYIQLICEAWESEVQGTLPNDPKILWQLAGASNEQVFNTCSSCVLSMFDVMGDSLVLHRLIEEVTKQQQMSELRAKAGRESGKVRRQQLKNQHLAKLNTCSIPVEQNTNTPSSIASAIAIAFANKESVASLPPLLGENSIPEETVKAGERALKAQRTSSKNSISKLENLPIGNAWRREFASFFGRPYLWGDGDNRAVSKLETAKVSIEEMITVIRSTWNNKESWHHNKTNNLKDFANKYNDLFLLSESFRKTELKPSKPTGCFAEEES